MTNAKILDLGIGFATGRKSFQRVLKTYIYNWKESGLTENKKVRLNLFIAYDLQYSKTKATDYTNIRGDLLELIDNVFFIEKTGIKNEADRLAAKNVVSAAEARRFFKNGYAGQRNAVLYNAIKQNMDYLMFLDDDEYPLAVTNNRSTAIWSGQHVLNTHLDTIANADITHGYHCGYISPIPNIQFNDILKEEDFQLFIEAISNDIVNWETIKKVMKNGGATYADTDILQRSEAVEVQEINNAKFISGANLCINLTKPERVNAFYNPPGARGEDTFLSTTLAERKVLKVPCYTFHDGFGAYHHLLDGVLPIWLKPSDAENEKVILRFYSACLGWIRYKPLLLYITQREQYEAKIEEIRTKLLKTVPKVCAFFGREEFKNIHTELERYHKHVHKHFEEFTEMQSVWKRIASHISGFKDKNEEFSA